MGIQIKRGDIFYASLDPVIGSEQVAAVLSLLYRMISGTGSAQRLSAQQLQAEARRQRNLRIFRLTVRLLKRIQWHFLNRYEQSIRKDSETMLVALPKKIYNKLR